MNLAREIVPKTPLLVVEKKKQQQIHNSLKKYASIFVRGHYLFRGANRVMSKDKYPCMF